MLEQASAKKEKILKLDDIEKSIEKTYESIQQNIPHNTRIDSLEVAKQVEQYRQFWKPEKTNVVLLAESHVYTDEKDYEAKCKSSALDRVLLPENPDYPVNFVRFVYCLGYGENALLNRQIKKNPGTWQFWKIFSSCITENEEDLGFRRVLKTGTRSFVVRLRNKADVLKKLKRKGIWLLDASIVGINELKSNKIKNKIIRICWYNYIMNEVNELKANFIIVIGKRVWRVLNSELQKLNIPCMVIDQPQARLSKKQHLENYKKYQEICKEYSASKTACIHREKD